MKLHMLLTALLGLAACSGGGSNGSSTLSPDSGTIQIGNAALAGQVQSGLSDGQQVNVTSNGTTITGVLYNTTLSGVQSGNLYGAGALSAAGNTFQVVAFSDDGASGSSQGVGITTTVVGSSASGTVGNYGQYAFYERTGTTLMPVSGSGTYTGEYRATYGSQTAGINGSATGGLIAVVGIASIPIDFGTSSITGATITNRTSLLADGSTPDTFADVMLSDVTFNNAGVFSGTATGGLNSTQTLTLNSGTFEGLIGGPNGGAVAGAILLTSQDGGAFIFTELGVFSAVRP